MFPLRLKQISVAGDLNRSTDHCPVCPWMYKRAYIGIQENTSEIKLPLNSIDNANIYLFIFSLDFEEYIYVCVIACLCYVLFTLSFFFC